VVFVQRDSRRKVYALINLKQSQFYLAGLDKIPFKESDKVKSCILLAENTFPLGELHAVEFPPDLDLIEEMEEKTKYLEDIISLPEPPERPYAQHSKKCNHCFRYKQCWNIIWSDFSYRDVLSEVSAEEFVSVLNKYLRADTEVKKLSEEVDEFKRQLRNIMDKEKARNLSVDFGNGLKVQVDLTEVSGSEYWVKKDPYVTMNVKFGG
jgi:hypothetical protein